MAQTEGRASTRPRVRAPGRRLSPTAQLIVMLWRARPLTFAIAIVQQIQLGRVSVAATVLLALIATYVVGLMLRRRSSARQ